VEGSGCTSHYVVLPLSLIQLVAEGDLKEGHAMVHVVTCQPLTIEIWVQSQSVHVGFGQTLVQV